MVTRRQAAMYVREAGMKCEVEVTDEFKSWWNELKRAGTAGCDGGR